MSRLALIAALLLAGCRAAVPLQAGTREPAQEVALMDDGHQCLWTLCEDHCHGMFECGGYRGGGWASCFGAIRCDHPSYYWAADADAPPTGSPAKE